jgi:Xaa-Pro aminopeptidase
VPGDEYARRRALLASDFGESKIDALFVSALPNIRYLTGFTGSNGALLLLPDGAIFFTDPRYTLQAAEQVSCITIVAEGPLIPRVAAVVKRHKPRRVGFERGRITFDVYERLKADLPMRSSLEPLNGFVERRRMIKSEAEIAAIRESVATNSRAFESAIKQVRPGMRENELAAEIDYRMRRRGAERPAFDTIVASGERTALPHAQPGAARIGVKELLLVDMGAMQGGYASDMTRMLHVGPVPRKVRRLYRAVLNAQLAAIDTVRPGVSAAAVDQAARRVLKSEGLDQFFVHSTGHGLGLEIHEPPRIGRKMPQQENVRLAEDMTITIEPGAYLAGFGGVRIEDTVVVTAHGCEILTPTSKELRVL